MRLCGRRSSVITFTTLIYLVRCVPVVRVIMKKKVQGGLMDFTNVAAIVPAGGSGDLDGMPKILHPLPNGRSILGQVLFTIKEVGFDTVVVVVNNYKFQEQTELHLLNEGFLDNLIFGSQHWRFGAGEAVAIGLEKLSANKIDTIFVAFADMPMWKPETIKKLLETHRKTGGAVTLASIRLTESTPEIIKRYGRVLRNVSGEPIDIIEPHDDIKDVSQVTTVNPSLYVFDRMWLYRNLHKVKPRERDDGYAAEIYLPPLVGIAHNDGAGVTEVPLDDPNEALGINAKEDLELVSRIMTTAAGESA